jgi:hypothetical protein
MIGFLGAHFRLSVAIFFACALALVKKRISTAIRGALSVNQLDLFSN